MQTNRRVLVTGGAGYIGSHTCKELAAAGYEPITYDNLSTGHRWAVKWGPLIVDDLADANAIADALTTYEPAAVIHIAASAYVGESMLAPRKYFQNNVRGSLNLLDAMLDAGTDRIVFSSSCATYGVPDRIPISEAQAQRPINPYGESKLFVERALAWYGKAYGLRSVALRYFNAAGADEDGELGEEHDPETHLIPLVIGAALGTRPPVTIFGDDYDTPDGTCVRDYTHVTDLAQAHVLALSLLDRGSRTSVLNLGTSVGASVRQVVSCVGAFAGCTVPHRFAARRAGDPAVLVADSSAALALGWTPRHSDLYKIVASAWQWHLSRGQALTGCFGPQLRHSGVDAVVFADKLHRVP